MTDKEIEQAYDEYNKEMGHEAFSKAIKSAERLAKIEVLESIINDISSNGLSNYDYDMLLDKYLSELKEGE